MRVIFFVSLFQWVEKKVGSVICSILSQFFSFPNSGQKIIGCKGMTVDLICIGNQNLSQELKIIDSVDQSHFDFLVSIRVETF
jgi:hypothetical protein